MPGLLFGFRRRAGAERDALIGRRIWLRDMYDCESFEDGTVRGRTQTAPSRARFSEPSSDSRVSRAIRCRVLRSLPLARAEAVHEQLQPSPWLKANLGDSALDWAVRAFGPDRRDDSPGGSSHGHGRAAPARSAPALPIRDAAAAPSRPSSPERNGRRVGRRGRESGSRAARGPARAGSRNRVTGSRPQTLSPR